jgi:hypothetical protein
VSDQAPTHRHFDPTRRGAWGAGEAGAGGALGWASQEPLRGATSSTSESARTRVSGNSHSWAGAAFPAGGVQTVSGQSQSAGMPQSSPCSATRRTSRSGGRRRLRSFGAC